MIIYNYLYMTVYFVGKKRGAIIMSNAHAQLEMLLFNYLVLFN